MKIPSLFFMCIGVLTIGAHNGYAQSAQHLQIDPASIQILKQSMPYTVTIDGKRIYSVESNHICSITVTMYSQHKYQFSLLNWPKKEHIDDTGYNTYTLQDSDNKPHIIRTDKIKGQKFLTGIRTLILNCQKSQKTDVTAPL